MIVDMDDDDKWRQQILIVYAIHIVQAISE